MKILRVIRSVDPAGGGPIEGLIRSTHVLNSLGHEIDVVAIDAPDDDVVKNFPFTLHALGPSKGKYGYTKRLRRWLSTNIQNYKCAFVHGLWQYHSLCTREACRRYNVPYFVFTHGMLDPWFKQRYPLKHLKKWLYWPWAEYRVLRDAKAVLFTSEEERKLARNSFWLYHCNEEVVAYGTAKPPSDENHQKKELLSRYPDLSDKRFILFLGRVHPKKGCDNLIRAFAHVDRLRADWALVIAGPDQVGWKNELTKLAEKSGVHEKIFWTGMLSGDAKWGIYRLADAFILPSHQENFGIVVAEAMACGLPVLVSNKVNIWREVESDKAGLVDNDDLDGTIRLLQRWSTMTNEDKQRMSQNARDCFNNRFEITRATNNLVDILHKYL